MVDRGRDRAADPADWPAGLAGPADRERFARYAEALAFYRG